MAVFSGDTVQADADGFLYFIGRRDEMIKTSGYRVSPTELEEAVYGMKLVGEVAAFGIDHPSLGQAIVLSVTAPVGATLDVEQLLAECRRLLPAYMIPADIDVHAASLPRNPNGKIDRRTLAINYADHRGMQP
jgi:acyl-CoA synthetase (AMP-forming)/AMP-acid ligase II